MFSLVPAGRPVQTNIQQLSETQFAFEVPSQPHFSHITVFLNPGVVIPDGAAVGIYIQLPGAAGFKFLGGLANEKPSAVYKINLSNASGSADSIKVGISLEPTANIASQLQQLEAQKQQQGSGSAANGTSTALVRAGQAPPSTLVLAQRIIKNAYDFTASFAQNIGGVEAVPLKSFQDWWTKFEHKIKVDPGFLERDQS